MTNELLMPVEEEAPSSVRTARTLLTRVALVLKLSTMHRLDNAAMQAPIRGFIDAVAAGLEERPELVLQMLDGNFFLNREIIKLDFSSYEAGHMLIGLLERVGAQELSIKGQLTEADAREFVSTFQSYVQSANPKGLLQHRFPQIALRAITNAELERLQPVLDPKTSLVRAYANLGIVIGQQLELLRARKPMRLEMVRRAIHELSDTSAASESLLIGLTRLEAYCGQVRFHLASVAALTLLMGRRLGLTRSRLSEAGMTAAFHDVALDELPPPTDEAVSPDEAEALERVPLKTILRLAEGALTGEALERIAVAWEHAQRAPEKGSIGFAQLVAVPCVFDRLTRPPAPRRVTLPDEAMRLILNQAGKRFDARVVRLFVSIVGLFPVGTSVRLDSGELGYVVEVPKESAAFARPRVRIVRSPSGPVDYVLDLATPGETRFITGSVDPIELESGSSVMSYLLA